MVGPVFLVCCSDCKKLGCLGGKERGKKTQEVRFLKSIMVEIKDVSLH